MKVTELRDGGEETAAVAIHAHVTIVQPADATRRAWVLRSVGLLAEANGLNVDDVVVGAEDLPGHDPVAVELVAHRDAAYHARELAMRHLKVTRAELTRVIDERARIAANLEAVLHGDGPARDAVASRQAERARLIAEFDAIRRLRASSEEALASAVDQRAASQSRRAAAVEALDIATARRRLAVNEAMAAAAALESARSLTTTGTDPVAALDAARQRLIDAEGEADVADPDHDGSPLGQRLTSLERHRAELIRRLAATGDSATVAVDESLTAVTKVADDAPPMVAAMALADTWRDLHQQIEALDRGLSDQERKANADLSLSRRTLAEAEIVANQPLLTPEQIAKVEAAHHDVLEAQDRSEARFGGSRARKRLEELRTDERLVLERLGFSTYADYMMSSSSHDLSPGRKPVEAARTAAFAAQERLDSLPGAGDRARRRIELLERRDTVAPKITELLGYEPAGPEAEHQLRTLREPAADDQESLAALATALTHASIDVGPGPHNRDDLIRLAQAYLTEDQQAEGERLDLKAAIANVEGAVAELRAARDRGEVEVPANLTLSAMAEPLGSDDEGDHNLREARWAEVEAAWATVAEAEAGVARHAGLSEELVALDVAMDEAGRREGIAADGMAAAEATLADAGDEAQLERAATVVVDAESALARNRSAEASAEAAVAAADGSGAEELQAANEAALQAAEGLVTHAGAEEQRAVTELERADRDLRSAISAVEAAEVEASTQDRETLIGDTDWALLARLATVRTVEGGRTPLLVLDEPFGVLQDDEVAGVLERFSRFAPVAQIIVVSNRPAFVEWAASVGPDRAGVAAA